MLSLFKRSPPSRVELLARADQARARGNVKKAISGYRQALALAPDDPAIHGKLAPLLARAGQGDAALESFQAAARAHAEKGFADRAIAVWAQAAEAYPNQPLIWHELAKLHAARGRRADAVKALVAGRSHLRRADERADAIALLREALALTPESFELRLDLAQLLGRTGARDEALGMLAKLVPEAGARIRAVRWAELRVAFSAPRLLAWMRGR